MSQETNTVAWWRLLNRYQWFVLIVAAAGWLLDCMDQQLFNLARTPAMKELLKDTFAPDATPAQIAASVQEHAGYSTAIFLLGWATGGLIFGVLGDRIGRAKTMLITILMYSGCTGLSALSQAFWDFALYRFITGLGVGGEFAVGVALVAEVMPDKARPYALSLLQALSTVGNIGAAVTSISLGHLETTGVLGSLGGWAAWRWMFIVGAFPALLVVVIRRNLKEPERWVQMKASGMDMKKLGDYGELFGNPNWRRPALVAGLLLLTGILLGFLGPATWSKTMVLPGFSLLKTVVLGFSLAALAAGLWVVYGGGGDTRYRSRAVVGLLLALAGVIGVWGIAFFSFELVRLVPLMGFGTLSVFGGYAIYFPELFPTRLRSTGTSFCYNVGRFVAASGPALLGLLTGVVFKDTGTTDPAMPLRYAGVTMCSVYLIGLVALNFAPETRGQPLPEEEPSR